MDTSGKALVEHWNWAAAKGVMNKNTAGALRAACTQVMSVVDNWEEADVRALDIEGTLVRFQNLKRKEFKPTVLETYKKRFRRAVASYLSYLDDPGGWKPRSLPVAQEKNNNIGETTATETTRTAKRELPPQSSIVEYPFPLREGQIARLFLPRDLKSSEVKRLAAFMSTLAVDFEPGSHVA